MNTQELPLYQKLATAIETQIRGGALRVGDRLPSLRAARRQRGVSISTVLQAYFWLENRGCIEARPQSGFYVRVPHRDMPPEPAFEPRAARPTEISVSEMALEVTRSASKPGSIPLGAACPSPDLFPNARLARILHAVSRENPAHSSRYEHPSGNEELRRQIARRCLEYGCTFAPSDIVITSGGMEALNLCLRAVAQPGDVIAVESPTYFGVLQAINSYGMKALEIPTHPRHGMDLSALERAIRKHTVKACVAMTNGHNPLGYVLLDERKKDLVDLISRYSVPLIEDDIYGDLMHDGPRPKSAKAFDRKGLVLLCDSFSKVLAPGYRLGWVHPGRFRPEVERLKLISSIASPSLAQMVLARFLASGGHDRHLRRLRAAFVSQVQTVSRAITKYFPAGTRLTRPQAGYVVWVEFPKRVNSVKLFRAAAAEGITISPGPVFSASGQFQNFIRLNCGYPWSEELDRALLALGRLAEN